MKNENNLVIQKANKSNTIIIFEKNFYLKSVETFYTFFKNSSKFKSIPLAHNKGLNYVINSEKRVTDLLKKRKNKNTISEGTYDKLRSVGLKQSYIVL